MVVELYNRYNESPHHHRLVESGFHLGSKILGLSEPLIGSKHSQVRRPHPTSTGELRVQESADINESNN